MDQQKTFDKVAHHLLTQRAQARGPDPNDGCEYRTSNGLRCAIGCLIPDDHPGLNFYGALGELLSEHPDLRDVFGISEEDDFNLLLHLQSIHDGPPVGEWRSKLIDLAKLRKLKDDVPKSFPGI